MDSRRMCPHCRAFITTTGPGLSLLQRSGRAARRRRDDPRSGLIGGFIPHARFNTMMILLINFGLYLATSIYSMKAGARRRHGGGTRRRCVDFGAKYPAYMEMGQWWRLVTAGFLHGGLLHILMNSWVLFDLGAQVEEIYGASRMLVIYFRLQRGRLLPERSVGDPGPSVGASAALFGLIGAMIAMGVRHRSALGDAVKGLYIRWAIYGLLFGLLPGVDNAAHVGGLATGFVVAYVAGLPRTADSPVERSWQVASWVCNPGDGILLSKDVLVVEPICAIILKYAISHVGLGSGFMLLRRRHPVRGCSESESGC